MNKSIFDIYEFVTQVSNLKDVVSNWCYFFCLVLVTIVMIYFFLFSTRRTNFFSRAKINELIKNGKYIPAPLCRVLRISLAGWRLDCVLQKM